MKTVHSVDDLDKPIDEYKIKANPHLTSQEKEVHINITKDKYGENIALFSSDHRTGITWVIRHFLIGNVEIDYIHLEDNCIVGIGARVPISLVSLKSKPRDMGSVSNCFAVPQ